MNQLNVYPVHREIPERDPEKVYRALQGENSYLLESSEGGEKIARYSFIGFNPALKIIFRNGAVDLKTYDPTLPELEAEAKNPIEAVKNLMHQFNRITAPSPRFFGGLVGYFSYDTIRYFLNIEENTRDDLKHPDCEFLLTKNNIIFDHKLGKTHLLTHLFQDQADKKTAEKELREIQNTISDYQAPDNEKTEGHRERVKSNTTPDEFTEAVKEIKEYIRAGDIFQTVLSQRLESRFRGDEFSIYQNLKKINPSPYMYYLNFDDRKIVGSSPEMLARVEDRAVETYPIAGTRPRGQTPQEDERLGKELLSDEKERAEHVMLVDLGRNDIGRVAEYGSVEVKRFMEIEKYSHVQHIVSEVKGRLREGEDEFSALAAVFPAGTVSGAPKVRAMEIIDELEPTRRGIYAGCVGYFSFNRNMDTAITIRTIDFENGKAYIQVGAGIVADSQPEKEYQETMNKGMGMLKALGVEE